MLFNFNIWSSLLLIGFIQGIVFSGILWVRSVKKERLSDRIATFILLIGSVYVAQWMLGFAGWYDTRDEHTTFMFYFPWRYFLFLGPLVWFYFLSLTDAHFKWKRTYWYHFIPGMLFFIYSLYPFLSDIFYDVFINDQDLAFFYETRGPVAEARNSSSDLLSKLIFFSEKIHTGVYLLFTLKAYRSYRKYINQEFSNTDLLSYNSLHWWIKLFAAGVIVTLVLEICGSFMDFSYQNSWWHYFIMSILVYVSGFLFQSIDPDLSRQLHFNADHVITLISEESSSTKTDSATEDVPDLSAYDHILRRLKESMIEDKIYLQSDLNLGQLAKVVGTNASVLSKVVNTRYGSNFNDFVNGYRCDAVKQAIDEGRHNDLTFLSLAIDAGFNSKSTFNRAFKKKYGINPGEYAKNRG